MRPIGEIRQLRLKQFVAQTGLSYADINGKLGRNRRDATLNQVAQAAANTSSGKPRRMGDAQARLLEKTFDLPSGWFDSDPDAHPDVISTRPSDGKLQLKPSPLSPASMAQFREEARRPQRADGSWPFPAVQREAIDQLSPSERDRLQSIMLAFLGRSSPDADWQSTAMDLAAQFDKERGTENFTLFMRAVVLKVDSKQAHPDGQSAKKARYARSRTQ